jgi:hypothetical protein
MMNDEYKLMRMCEDKIDWEMQITGCIDTCKDYQTDDEAEYEYCNPEYKIIPVDD